MSAGFISGIEWNGISSVILAGVNTPLHLQKVQVTRHYLQETCVHKVYGLLVDAVQSSSALSSLATLWEGGRGGGGGARGREEGGQGRM